MTADESVGDRAAPRALRVTCVSPLEPAATALAQTIHAILPTAIVETADVTTVRSVPETDCIVLDAAGAYEEAVSTLRLLRARGYPSAAILVVAADAPPPDDEAARLGVARQLTFAELPRELPNALREATRLEQLAGSSPVAAQALRALHQSHRLMAAGEYALRLQHALNNPLAALLAEAQLLELEELAPDHRRSVERIIELSRRVIEVTRSMEGIGPAR
jgi:signal transduction histidine kinase